MILSWIIFTSPRHDHTDEQHRPCVASPFKSEQKRAVNNAQKGYIVEEGDFPERPVTRSGSERNQSIGQYLSVHKDSFSDLPTNKRLEEAVVGDWPKMMKFEASCSATSMASGEQKRRTEEANREFNQDWTESFAFICNTNGIPTCHICHEKLAHNKKSNLERHFTTKHTQFAGKYPTGDARKKAVEELQKKQQQSSSMLSNWVQSSNNVSLASFAVTLEFAKRGKPLTQMVSTSKIVLYVHLKNCFVISKTKQKS
ncbi:hypothetical protein AVEN_3356-1 [Araneus ventricosus]|uniref:SPIN-DOC-like zinc-finger domain-containing protein n=1 Tax=Araneus ventricosus TaxID=182803 RepID=A0A4Y2FM48_ARAVE|nr:hypothetical protein AVEN_3356-1 [Araneus ventricosus]